MMIQAIYTAASGLENQQTRLDTISTNIANASTIGYKSTRADFKDAMYTLMNSPVSDNKKANLLTGSGVLLSATTSDFTDGSLSVTGGLLDFAIKGNGFFTVKDAGGEIYYTRNGSFNISSEGGNRYLVTAQGYYVLDAAGNKIRLPNDVTNLNVADSGELSDSNGSFATLGIVEFENPDGLSAAGGACYQATGNSGNPVAAGNSSVVQGSLENSNVDMAQELTLLIRAQRSYSLASKALQTADEMEGLANNMH